MHDESVVVGDVGDAMLGKTSTTGGRARRAPCTEACWKIDGRLEPDGRRTMAASDAAAADTAAAMPAGDVAGGSGADDAGTTESDVDVDDVDDDGGGGSRKVRGGTAAA
jgi:hypothetical protein